MVKKRITKTDRDNILTEHFLFKRFELLALNQFKWTGLPEGMEERHIERVLFNDGKALFFEDKELGLFCLPCGASSQMNIYNDPLYYTVTGYQYSERIKASEAVLIENNKLRLPTRSIVLYFVNELYECLRTRSVNLKTLKAPFLASGDDKTILTLKRVLEEIDDNVWAIFGDKSYNLEDAVKVFQTGVKCMTGELTDLYHDILNEGLTYLGINNANTDKKERLITSEADSNNQLIDSCMEMFYEARKRACDAINDMFGEKYGIHVDVELRTPREDPAQIPLEGSITNAS